MRGIQVLEWRDVTGKEIVHRVPEEGSGDVSIGAQLTVRESQAAIFFRDGQALDTFGPGRHTLTALNLPLLQSVINIPFEGTTPFQAEVYFVNMRTFTDMKWGTPQPVPFRDSEFKMIRLRAHGLYTMRISAPQLFVNIVVGTEHNYTTDDVGSWLRDFIVARFNDTLGEQVETILDLPQMYEELSVAVRSRLIEDFDRYGVELVDFIINAVVPPDELAEMIDERGGMEAVGDMDRFMRYETARAIRDMPQAGAGGAAGGPAAAGAGLGAGVGMGAAMVGAMTGAFTGQQQGAQPAGSAAAPPPGPICPNCQAQTPAGAKFCPQCGQPMTAGACANCGTELPAGAKFCAECGQATESPAQAPPPSGPPEGGGDSTE